MSIPVLRNGEIITSDIRSIISTRYRTVTRAINQEFWNSQSEINNSLYVGSYGRGTAVDTSDIDILVELPENEYNHYNSARGNGQSRLLQAVRSAIQRVYPRSHIKADGQVVKIDFSDNMQFEILPAFKNVDLFGNCNGTYRYPDTNMSGNWRSTNPKAEQKAMKQKNIDSNGLFYDTCKHVRRVRDDYFGSYHLSGIVIDSFVYNAIRDWHWITDGESTSSTYYKYEQALLDYFQQNKLFWSVFCLSLTAPGSGQNVDISSSLDCLEKVLRYIAE